jgi:D-alanine-D-alanine ligase
VKDLLRKIAVLMEGSGAEGLTIDVHIVKNAEEIEPAIVGSRKFDRALPIEKFVSGRKFTIGILGDQALPILEIIPKGSFYNFTNRHSFLNPQAGGGADHVCPAQIDEKKTAEIQQFALRAFRAAGGQVYGRVDVILSDSGELFVLEINTIPGITEISLLRAAAAVAGIGYSDLFARIIALSRATAEGSQR